MRVRLRSRPAAYTFPPQSVTRHTDATIPGAPRAAEDLDMSHGEYTKEDSRKDLSASLTGLVLGIGWVLVVAVISYFIAKSYGG